MRFQQFINEEQSKYEDVINILKKDCAPFLKELKQTKTKQLLYRGHNYASGTITKKKVRNNREPKDMDEETSEYLDELFKKKFGWYARSAGVFASSDIDCAYEYGKPFLFFPIGKYKYIWSPSINDLYTKIDNEELVLDYDAIEDESYEYDQLYGEGNSGHFEYDGIEVDGSDQWEAKDFVIEYSDEYGIEDEKYFDYGLLEWIPELTYKEYFEQEIDSIKEQLRNLVSSYTNKNLKQAIMRENEITFQCKEYYLVDPEKPGLENILAHEFF